MKVTNPMEDSLDARNSATSLGDSSLPWPCAAEWVLRICFAARCFALGDAFLWNEWERDSDIFGLLLFDWQWPEATAMRFENGSLLLVVLAGAVSVASPMVTHRLTRKTAGFWFRYERWLLLFAVIWEVTFALAITIRSGVFYSQLTLPSHLLRIAMPVALLACCSPSTMSQAHSIGPRVLSALKWCVVATFAAHGWKALMLSPEYTTLILGGWKNTFGESLAQSNAESILRVIGALDILFAALLIFTKSRYVLFYLIAWGMISAIGRTVGGGWLHYPETFLRVAHAGGPLVLFLEWNRIARNPLPN